MSSNPVAGEAGEPRELALTVNGVVPSNGKNLNWLPPEEATRCAICEARFGLKFAKLTCLRCQHSICTAHLLASEHLSVHSKVSAGYSGGGHGLCMPCILDVWEKSDDHLMPPKNASGRIRHLASRLFKTLGRPFGAGLRANELIAIKPGHFEAFNVERATAIFRHQTEIDDEFMVRDLTLFARLYAVSQGRSVERSVCLRDVYAVSDWLKSRPYLPDWAHGIKWSVLESSPASLSYLVDVYRIVEAATGSSAARAAAMAAMAYEQARGKSFIGDAYLKVKDALGLNVNVARAFQYYFVGVLIIQLLKERE